eukprot:CAMPEP_0170116716 /NCGR_PEP_ID=MMETSP0020_2-20130122/12473_1 /TAXON_ID=98059 /ORGANISM="Dinobryon sp., Strain UTEXLB2267" /LENGTH=51 /DNA_ID=CAMNT_0010344963 /DNA_START=148 /DNA_END=300 /DNA_ORIENTATION=+
MDVFRPGLVYESALAMLDASMFGDRPNKNKEVAIEKCIQDSLLGSFLDGNP